MRPGVDELLLTMAALNKLQNFKGRGWEADGVERIASSDALVSGRGCTRLEDMASCQ